jgi:protein-tyrosine-phosphatase
MSKDKKVLFICRGNWFRSQMAAAIYNKITNTENADSVGAYVGALDEPEGRFLVDLFPTEDFFEVMEENGMNVRDCKTKGLKENMLSEYDIVVSMAEEIDSPTYLNSNKNVIRWNVENPKSVDREIAQDTFDKIYKLVQGLI